MCSVFGFQCSVFFLLLNQIQSNFLKIILKNCFVEKSLSFLLTKTVQILLNFWLFLNNFLLFHIFSFFISFFFMFVQWLNELMIDLMIEIKNNFCCEELFRNETKTKLQFMTRWWWKFVQWYWLIDFGWNLIRNVLYLS